METEFEKASNINNHLQKSAIFYTDAGILYRVKLRKFKKLLRQVESLQVSYSDFLSVYLLMGYSLENLFNGVLIKTGKIPIKQNEKIQTLNHNLQYRIKEFDYTFSNSQKEFLGLLSSIITYGKYPNKKRLDTLNKKIDITKKYVSIDKVIEHNKLFETIHTALFNRYN